MITGSRVFYLFFLYIFGHSLFSCTFLLVFFVYLNQNVFCHWNILAMYKPATSLLWKDVLLFLLFCGPFDSSTTESMLASTKHRLSVLHYHCKSDHCQLGDIFPVLANDAIRSDISASSGSRCNESHEIQNVDVTYIFKPYCWKRTKPGQAIHALSQPHQ